MFILGFTNQIFRYNSVVQASEWSTEINKSLLGAHQICSFTTIHLLELCCVSALETRQFWIKSRGLGPEPLAPMMATDIGGQRAANNLIGGPVRDKTIYRKARHVCACWDVRPNLASIIFSVSFSDRVLLSLFSSRNDSMIDSRNKTNCEPQVFRVCLLT